MNSMDTPIFDFARQYAESKPTRLHMPGHKGENMLGCENLDLTEIIGADELYKPSGIIAKSEDNASKIFGCKTIYSTEGSSLCIRAMLYLAIKYGKEKGRLPKIAAARNVHQTFMTAAALLDFEIDWLTGENEFGYISSEITAESLENYLKNTPTLPTAVYVTSPDYLGNIADISGLAKICHKYDTLLLVDNAHGAYLKFLERSLFPIDLGADLCCDSAHKTLPCLTGGAYLHISKDLEGFCKDKAKEAMSLFGSTSPSYLIMQSLDICNKVLNTNFVEKLKSVAEKVESIKNTLSENGYTLCGNEPMKITIATKIYGYTGFELADILQKNNVFCEFYDKDYLVLMPSANTSPDELDKVLPILLNLEKRSPITDKAPKFALQKRILSPRQAIFSANERLPVSECEGRICAELSFSCPPAIPIIMCGEQITSETIDLFNYYEIPECTVVKE